MSFKVRIGVNPISWVNDDLPSLGAETLLETALSEGAAIGYEGFELGQKFPSDPAVLKATLDAHHLVCVSGWYSGRLAALTAGQTDAQAIDSEIARCASHMEKLKHNNVDVLVYGESAGSVQGQIDTPVNHRPCFVSQELWQSYARRLDGFGAHLIETYGIRLAYHHHMGTYVESPNDIDRLMALTDPAKVFLLFDTGHAYFGGAHQPLELLHKHIHRVAHVHCKDVRASVIDKAHNESWSFLDSVLNGAFTVPGDGDVDFSPILRALKNAGYGGWLVVEAEQDPAVAPSQAYAQKGYDTLRRIVSTLN